MHVEVNYLTQLKEKRYSIVYNEKSIIRLICFFLFALMLHGINAEERMEFTSSNLPIVVIDTRGQEIPDEPKINADMGIIYNGEGVRNYITDPFNNYQGKIGIEIRGSSAQTFPKKQYAVETRDIQGNDTTVSLLGFPPEDDWILYAPYSDKSLIRNVLAYKLSNDMGRYASRTKFCEVVLNGEYMGVYVMMEKIKRDKNRVDISKLEPDESTGDDLTGGYIFKIDKLDGAEIDGWESSFLPFPGAWQRIFYQYHYPDEDDITPVQEEYIQNFMFKFESLMDEPINADPQTGYVNYLNIDTFVDNFIIIEMSKNIDGYRLSTYFHKDRDSKNGKLSIGPIWDYNLAFGNADYYNGAIIPGWQVNFHVRDDYWQMPFWWQKLMADSNFVNRINERWFQLRSNVLDTHRIGSLVDSLTMHLDEAQKRNFQRWPILGEYIWPNAYIGGSYSAEIRYLKQWIQSRVVWMDENIPGTSAAISANSPTHSLSEFTLEQNYPNPFNSSTRIGYSLNAPANVQLKIYDFLGRTVKTIRNEIQQPGRYYALWNGTDEQGRLVSSGIYLCKMVSGNEVKTVKLILMK